MSRATNDLNEVRTLIGPAIMYSFQTAVTVVFALPVMIYIDLKLTMLAFLPLAYYVRLRGNILPTIITHILFNSVGVIFVLAGLQLPFN